MEWKKVLKAPPPVFESGDEFEFTEEQVMKWWELQLPKLAKILNEIDKDDGSRIFVTGADGTKGIKMPEIDRMEIGDKFEVHNLSGSNLYIWPYDGGDQIWGRIPGAAVTVAGRSMTIIVLANDRLWQAAEVTEP